LLFGHVQKAMKQGYVNLDGDVTTGYVISKEDRKFLMKTVINHYLTCRDSVKKSIADCSGVKVFSLEAPKILDLEDVMTKAALYLDKIAISDILGESLIYSETSGYQNNFKSYSAYEKSFSAQILREYIDLRLMQPLAEAEILELILPPWLDEAMDTTENAITRISPQNSGKTQKYSLLWKMMEDDRNNDNLKEKILEAYMTSEDNKRLLTELFDYDAENLKGCERTAQTAENAVETTVGFYIGKVAEAFFTQTELDASLVAHSNAMWTALNSKLSYISDENQVNSKIFSSLLKIDLGYLQNVDLARIIEVRKSEGDAFKNWRECMKSSVDHLSKESPGTEEFEREVKLIENEMKHDFETVYKEVQRLKERFRVFGIKALATSSAMIISLSTSSPLAILASYLSGSITLGWDLQSIFQQDSRIKENSIYYLWKSANY
jgi:hypothetical protein